MLSPLKQPLKLLRLRNVIIWIIIIAGVIYWFNKDRFKQYDIQGKTMGTTYMVKYWVNNNSDPQKIRADINNRLQQINNQVSTWINTSDIVSFNNSQTTKWQKVKPFFAQMVLLASNICTTTNGVFDISISPLIDIWGFDARGKITKKPSQQQLNSIDGLYGCDKININTKKSIIAKTNPQVQINLSAIAKGGGVDEIGKLLEAKGIVNYLVEIGGEVRVKGKKIDGSAWNVGIEQPSTDNRNIRLIIALNNEAIATSGDYRNYFEENGVRYSHIINPHTKQPIRHNLASITVVAESTALADALATGLFVMGANKALKFAEKENIAIYMIIRDKGKFKTITSTKWNKKFGEE